MEETIDDMSAPYASARSVLDIIRRFREGDLPEPLTFEGLAQMGVPQSTTSPTLRALRFLGLVGEGGNHLEAFERLRRASAEEYADVLAELIRSAYVEVFRIVDPSQDDYGKISDAFAKHNPAKQQQKMVRLFLRLCAEAGIAPRQPKRHRRPKPADGMQRKDGSQGAVTAPHPSPFLRHYGLVDAIVSQLPQDGRWSKDKRQRWLNAVESAIDLLIDMDDGETVGERQDP